MAESFPHYVKLARSLALTSTILLQACVGSSDTGEPGDEPAPTPPAPTSTSTAPGETGGAVAPSAALVAVPEPDAGVAPDAGFVSGPLPPPELPASFA